MLYVKMDHIQNDCLTQGLIPFRMKQCQIQELQQLFHKELIHHRDELVIEEIVRGVEVDMNDGMLEHLQCLELI